MNCQIDHRIRFQKKLPTTASDITAGEIIVALFRMRGSSSCDSSLLQGFLFRLCHAWSQMVERSMDSSLVEHCPDPTIQAKVHPFTKASRSRGNKSLEVSLLQRFQSRGGGYISGKDCNLSQLGLAAPKTKLGTKTCAEFTTRILLKTAEFMRSQCLQSRVLNFTFDCAYVSEEHVP